jgi:hypothetical protein
MKNDPLLIIYYIIASLGIIGSLHVLITILHTFKSKNSCFTILLLLLHFSLLAEEIFALPNVFNHDETVCEIAESFFEYFGLMNIIVVGLLVYAHRWSILDPSVQVPARSMKIGEVVIILFPMIVFLPFIDRVYEMPDNSPWCSVPYADSQSSSGKWFLGVYLAWVWLVLLGSVLSSVDLMIRLSLTSKRLLRSYLTTVGLYTVVSLCCWIPRSIVRFAGDDTNAIRFVAYIPIYLSGMMYTVIFKRSQERIEQFEISRMGSITDFMFLFDERDRQISDETTHSEISERLVQSVDVMNTPSTSGLFFQVKS